MTSNTVAAAFTTGTTAKNAQLARRKRKILSSVVPSLLPGYTTTRRHGGGSSSCCFASSSSSLLLRSRSRQSSSSPRVPPVGSTTSATRNGGVSYHRPSSSLAFSTFVPSPWSSSSSSSSSSSTLQQLRRFGSPRDNDDDHDDDWNNNSNPPSVTTASGGVDGASTTATAKGTVDQSAAAQSRATFSMPRKSLDDSRPAESISWNQLGLWTELITCLTNEMKLPSPTTVQQMVIPPLLQLGSSSSGSSSPKTTPSLSTPRNVAFLAATGSGKTLAYCLPIMQLLKQEEVFGTSTSSTTAVTTPDGTTTGAVVVKPKPKRPRAIVLAPTRELCLQITSVCKQLSHSIKLSVLSITGGSESIGTQRKQIESKKSIDLLVATPGRLHQHVVDGTIILSNKYIRYIVLDEMDTMIEQGFSNEIQHLLYPLLYHKKPSVDMKPINPDIELVSDAPSVILTSATMTQVIQKMIGDTDDRNTNKDSTIVSAKRHYTKSIVPPTTSATAGAVTKKFPPLVLPRMNVYKAPGLHKAIPRLQQVFVDTASVDKLSLLIDVLSNHQPNSQLQRSKGKKNDNNDNDENATPSSLTMVFCNTAASCRAVEYALAEARFGDENTVRSYHGELNSAMRSKHLQEFRDGIATILVCTDLAARGLDIPAVDHVVMFDFPLNALDYLHRSGRTARGVALTQSRPGNGKVTALVTKRDQVLANAISQAVQRGEPLDGLSSRKTDYLPGGRLNLKQQRSAVGGGGGSRGARARPNGRRGGGGVASSSMNRATLQPKKKMKAKDTTRKKQNINNR